ncbi:MAG: hypothetical protein U0736_06695 [Gemmataceae bacterium]
MRAVLLLPLVPVLLAAEPIRSVGLGSYTTTLPPGAKAPQDDVYRTDNVRGPMPTNDWWSSLAWMKFSERHYAHPLAMEAEPGGLRVFYPGRNVVGTKDAIFGFMPAKNGEDVVLGHSEQDTFPDARVDGFSDWFVAVRFAAGPNRLRVSYGHGSPFVYATVDGGDPRLTFGRPVKVWAGDERSAVLGVTVGDKHYGLFGPTGSTWTSLAGRTFTNRTGGKGYFALAILPDASERTLERFRQYAYSHVTDTRVDWAYDEKAATVTTTFTVRTSARRATGRHAVRPSIRTSGGPRRARRSLASTARSVAA